MRKLKIISDGTCKNTKIVDAETGETIDGIYGITWELNYGEHWANVTVKMRGIPTEIVVGASNEEYQNEVDKMREMYHKRMS